MVGEVDSRLEGSMAACGMDPVGVNTEAVKTVL